MTTPDVKQASEIQDPTEVNEPQARGWFQPKPAKPAAEDSEPPAQVSDSQTHNNGSGDHTNGQAASLDGPAADTDEPTVQLRAVRPDTHEPPTTPFKAVRPDTDEPPTTQFKAVRPDTDEPTAATSTGEPSAETSTAVADADGSPASSTSSQAGADASGSVDTITEPPDVHDGRQGEAAGPRSVASNAPAEESGPEAGRSAPEPALRPDPGDPAGSASGAEASVSRPIAETGKSETPPEYGRPAAETGDPHAIDSPQLLVGPRPGPADRSAADGAVSASQPGTGRPEGQDVSQGTQAPRVSSHVGVDAPGASSGEAPAHDTRAPVGKPATKKPSRSVFGSELTSRPDMLTDAETVVMPSLKGSTTSATELGNLGSARVQNGAAVKQPQATPMTPVATSAVFADADTQIMPLMKPGESAGTGSKRARKLHRKRERPAFTPPERYTPKRRTTQISRLLLLGILILQAVLSLRLRNTAFEDESLYLYSGHMELEHLLHGSALQGSYSSYFSGSPVLYPVAAAALDQIGGLALARGLSLFEMLATTVMLYSMTKRLFNERAGLCASAFFAVAESVIFLGNFATYDATCLSLLACAAWIMVRTSAFRWPVFILAAPMAALAVGVKYAGLLFVPTIALLPVLAGWPERGRRVLWYPVAFGGAVAGLLYGALRLGGSAYMTAISSTTTKRAQGTTTDLTILREAAEWGGVLFALAVIGSVAYVWRVRTESDEKIAPAGGRVRRTALGVVLTGSALLAPAYQAHLHTDISFLKHIGFGLFFAAPMAGFGLARIMGDYFRRPQFGVAAWSLALVLGMVQSGYLYHQWPECQPFVTAFAKYVKPHGKYLVEVPEVPIYYLMGNPDAQPDQFTSTFYINYFNKKGVLLTGPTGFTAAVQDGYFQIIAYNNDVTLAADGALAKALTASKSYYLAKKIVLSDVFGPVVYYIWVKKAAPPATSKAKAKATKK